MPVVLKILKTFLGQIFSLCFSKKINMLIISKIKAVVLG